MIPHYISQDLLCYIIHKWASPDTLNRKSVVGTQCASNAFNWWAALKPLRETPLPQIKPELPKLKIHKHTQNILFTYFDMLRHRFKHVTHWAVCTLHINKPLYLFLVHSTCAQRQIVIVKNTFFNITKHQKSIIWKNSQVTKKSPALKSISQKKVFRETKQTSTILLHPLSLKCKGFQCCPRSKRCWNRATRESSSDWLPSWKTSAGTLPSPRSTTATTKTKPWAQFPGVKVCVIRKFQLFTNGTTRKTSKDPTPTPEGLRSLQLRSNALFRSKSSKGNVAKWLRTLVWVTVPKQHRSHFGNLTKRGRRAAAGQTVSGDDNRCLLPQCLFLHSLRADAQTRHPRQTR